MGIFAEKPQKSTLQTANGASKYMKLRMFLCEFRKARQAASSLLRFSLLGQGGSKKYSQNH
jgi:hypothetical protein